VIKKQEINEINEINEIRAKEVKIIATNKSVAVINTTRKINFHDSGRFYLWGQAIKLIKANNYIYGYGPQADRKYIGENVSNTYLYMYLTAGIFGIISLFVIAAIHVYMLFYNIFIFKIFKQRHNSIEKISIFLILFIYSRTIIENTFAVFSIDMLIFLFANYYINAYYQKNKKLIELN
jgi:O-antigen ligase